MSNWLALSLTLLLFADADVPRVNSLRPPANPAPSFPSDEEIPLFPNAAASSDNAQSQTPSQSKTAPPAKNTTLQETSKLALIRYVSGEFAKAVKPLPALTPEELKQLLSPFLNFSKERSAAVQWFDTLPPEMKKAIQDRTPVVGMDREELIAAIGKPDHKVRERDSEGNDIEDWIYGQPPSKTVFVRFRGDRVTSIKQFPQ